MRRIALGALTTVTALLLAATSTQAAGTGDPFDTYSGTAPLAGYKPGAVLATRTVSYHLTGISAPLTAIQILYRSTGALGQPTANVTSVVKPPVASGPVKVISYQSFYDSLNPADEPSVVIAGGTSSGGSVWDAENGLIAGLLTDGFTLNIPDTEGQTADFAAGPEYGMNTLDSLRAVEQVSATGITSATQMALEGYSGGAIATDWAAQLAPSYAADVNKQLVGAAEGGVLVDPAHNLTYVGGSSIWAGVIPMAIIGVARSYGIDLEQYMNAYGKSLYAKMANDSIGVVLGEYPGVTWAQLTLPQYANPDSVKPFVDTVNKLDMGYAPMPTIPMMIGQGAGGQDEGTQGNKPGIGAGDGVMITGDVRSLAHQMCAAGLAVDYQQYDASSHFPGATNWEADATPWLMDRFSGKTPPNDCSSIAGGNSLALQQYVGPSSTAAPAPSAKASFVTRRAGRVTEVDATLPAGASHFYFRWQLGVSFGRTITRAQVAKEIAIYALPSGKRAATSLTALSAPHGRITFVLSKGTLARFSFHLAPKHLYLSHAEAAYVKAHHITTLTGTFEVRSSQGVTYRTSLSVPR